jgi:hypothetical protein
MVREHFYQFIIALLNANLSTMIKDQTANCHSAFKDLDQTKKIWSSYIYFSNISM